MFLLDDYLPIDNVYTFRQTVQRVDMMSYFMPLQVVHIKDLVKLMEPKYIEVIGLFTPRGGISIYPYANYGQPGTKYEQTAEQRMLTHQVL